MAREYAAISMSRRTTVERGRSNRGVELHKIPQFQRYLDENGITYRQWKERQKRGGCCADPDLEMLELQKRKLSLYKYKNKNVNRSEYHHKYKLP